MSVDVVQQKLLNYKCETPLEQENALKEIAQEIALMALSRAGFFRVAAFQGGTCLRILYGLERFSEDLDFVLTQPDNHFDWEAYINGMKEEFDAYGYQLEVANKSRLDKAIKSAFIKADSTGGLLLLKDNRTNRPTLQIKLEVDTNPPTNSQFDLKYLDFPLSFSVQAQDLPSLFASKCHALLCREYVKGRDWYDFIWYVSHNVNVNLPLLQSAINQAGPWKNSGQVVTHQWLVSQLKNRINNIDWLIAKKDISRFLKPREAKTLDLWGNDFFTSRVDKLASLLEKV